ncbi:TonB-dependent receptor [Methylotenera sp. G11]|uniref:TonB-dependent receptor n=1 Tax=Methylotenera sp. G11 TaxID=1506585 RepID=UPI00064738DD|nr:TonB-dependent siderophore receptor [Methylotenera sp. G11]
MKTTQARLSLNQNASAFPYENSRLKSAIQLAILGLGLAAGASHGTAYAEAPAKNAIELKEVEVVGKAESDTKPVKGYNAKSSRSATKTDTDLKDTPQSVTVVTQDVMKDQSIQSISEAVRYVPGVTASQGEGNRDALNFRGAGVTTGDFYLDGVRDDIQTYRDLYNTDRIEVLRGSNAMIFGRGGSGGVINRVSKEAGWDPVRELSLTYGAYDQKRATIDVGNGINDVAAFRLNTVYEDANSYRDGVNLERYGITPTLTIKPTDSTKIVLSAEYFMDKRIGDRGMPSIGTGLKNRAYDIGDHSTFFGSARLSPNETETKAFNALIEHAFDNGLTVRNRTRYADYDKFYQNVYARGAVKADGTVDLGAYHEGTDRQNLINQTDLTYNLKAGGFEHRLLAGMELGRQDTKNFRLSPNGSNDNLPGATGNVNAEDPAFTGTLNLNNLRIHRKSEANITAFYLQDQIILSPKWEMVLGVRHDKFELDYTDLPTTADPTRNVKLSVTDNKVSPRAGLIYKPMENLSLYASYSQSFVPRAGDQLTGLSASTTSLSPEKFTNHEIGAKFDVNPDLALTAAIYKLVRENIAAASDIPGQTILVDGQETKGLELGISGKLTDKWSIFGGYAYQHGEITKDQNISGSQYTSGTDLGQTPKHTFSLWNRYDFNEVWGAAIGMVSRSDMYALTPTTTTSTLLPGYTRFDAAVYGKFSKNLRLQVNLENLTNKEYALSAHNNNNIVPGAPLTGRATLIYNF